MRELNYKSTASRIIYFFCTALLLIAPALYNKYPLVYPDSGTYIVTLSNLIPPVDRTVGYGLFMRIVTWKSTLWTVVFSQGLIIGLLLFETLKIIIRKERLYALHFSIVVLLVLFSSVGWFAGQIMPDIFAPALILTLFIILAKEKITLAGWVLLLAGGFFFCISHFSHILLSGLLIAVSIFYAFIFKDLFPQRKKLFLRSAMIGLVLLASTLFLAFNHLSHGYGFRLNRSSNVFITARLSETGILKKYLDEKCAEKQYSLCACKDSLPGSVSAFLWNETSPLYRLSGGWAAADAEYSGITKDVFSTPRFMAPFLWQGGCGTVVQLFRTGAGEGLQPYRMNTGPWYAMRDHMPAEFNQYTSSQQYYGLLDFKMFNTASAIAIMVSLIALFYMLYKKAASAKFRFFVYLIVTAIFFNAAITSCLANVADRMNARVIWLVTFAGLAALYTLVIGWRRSWHEGNNQ